MPTFTPSTRAQCLPAVVALVTAALVAAGCATGLPPSGEGTVAHSPRVVRVVADPAVERGGALVEIGRATLDAQIGSAVERVRQILLGASDDGANDDRAA